VSWTGSEKQRREQGICRPPVSPADRTPKYRIPAGTSVHIRRIGAVEWQPYVMKREQGFDRFESRVMRSLVFRTFGWQIRVSPRRVINQKSN